MRKNLKWLVAAVAAGLLVMIVAIPALAAGSNGASGDVLYPAAQPGFGKGNWQGLGVGHNEAVIELLGMTWEEIHEQRQAGNSLVQIAAARNVTEEALITAIMAGKQSAVQNLVDAGKITRAQADQRLAQMEERVRIAVNRTTFGPPEWSGANNGQNRICNETAMMQKRGQRRNEEKRAGLEGNFTGSGNMVRAGRNAR